MRQSTLDIDFAEEIPHRSQANGFRKMPAPQYLGTKHKLLPWICEFIPEGTNTVLDGFSGSQSFAFEMKKRGCKVYSKDFLAFCHMTGVGLVENKKAVLTENDLEILFVENENRGEHMLRFKDIFFIESECVFLDNFRANIELLDCPYKQALALAVMCRSLTRKTIMGHFAHLRAIPYARNPLRVKRNPSIARPIRDLFTQLLPEYMLPFLTIADKTKATITTFWSCCRTCLRAKLKLLTMTRPTAAAMRIIRRFTICLKHLLKDGVTKPLSTGINATILPVTADLTKSTKLKVLSAICLQFPMKYPAG